MDQVASKELATVQRRIEQVEGRVEAGLIEMGAKVAAARAAEERERNHMKRAEKYAEAVDDVEGSQEEDPFEAVGRAYADLARAGDGPPLEGVPPLQPGLENGLSDLDSARAAKRGR